MNKIKWCDETWNPIIGCQKISIGCRNCYAEKMANRISHMDSWIGEQYREVIGSDGKWNHRTHLADSHMDLPQRIKKPKRIFVGSMTDIFLHSQSSTGLVDVFRLFELMSITPQHTFLLLTKRPEEMLNFMEPYVYINGIPTNIWFGVTVCNQEEADQKIPYLLKTPAAKRFVSIEPMLGAVSLFLNIDPLKWGGYDKYDVTRGLLHNTIRQSHSGTPVNKIDWIICGSESGPSRRPFDEEWARVLMRQCQYIQSPVPFFFKQRYIGNQKFSMPLLDGKIWDQIPEK